MTTWAELETLIAERWSGKVTGRDGSSRYYQVPSPTGGSFLVEVTLRPRWCSLAIDRIRTTDRDTETAALWLKEHVWPVVDRTLGLRSRGYATLPNGGPTFTSASPIDRAELIPVLTAWVEAELTWGTRAEEA